MAKHKPVGPVKLFMGDIEIGDVKSFEIQAMANTDQNKFLEHMKAMEAKAMSAFGVPASFLSAPSNSTGWAADLTTSNFSNLLPEYGPSPLQALKAAMDSMREQMPCSHCSDRDIWKLGLTATLIGRMCRACADECLTRGITVRRIKSHAMSVVRIRKVS